MNTCNNGHISINWETGIDCPICYKQKQKQVAAIDIYINGQYLKLTMKNVGNLGCYVHIILSDKYDWIQRENYIEVMDLFKK